MSPLVFAGPGGTRAFVTTAHRGQQPTDPSLTGVPGAGDPQLTTPRVGRAHVWVFDATTWGRRTEGRPRDRHTLRRHSPRPRGEPRRQHGLCSRLQVGQPDDDARRGGPQRLRERRPRAALGGVTVPGGLPGPSTDSLGEPAPGTGLIVELEPVAGEWTDTLGRDWSAAVHFELADKDVSAIDAATLAQPPGLDRCGHDALQHGGEPGEWHAVRVEHRSAQRGPRRGARHIGRSSVQSDLAEARITVVSGSASCHGT